MVGSQSSWRLWPEINVVDLGVSCSVDFGNGCWSFFWIADLPITLYAHSLSTAGLVIRDPYISIYAYENLPSTSILLKLPLVVACWTSSALVSYLFSAWLLVMKTAKSGLHSILRFGFYLAKVSFFAALALSAWQLSKVISVCETKRYIGDYWISISIMGFLFCLLWVWMMVKSWMKTKTNISEYFQ